MPKTLNPVNVFPANIPNFPLSGNNEPLALGPLEAAFQALLNRTEHTRLRVDGLEGGVKRVQRFASRAALSAASGFADGDTVDVEGYGRYRLYNPSALTADGLWVLTAAGGGRWVHVLNDLKAANSGLATLTGGGRLSQDVRDGSILTAHLADGSVTAAKLAAGAVVGHLGYTPLNKAGDVMNGLLELNAGAGALALKPGSLDHAYLMFFARSATPGVRSGYIGYPGSGATQLVIANEIGDIRIQAASTVVSGVITGRYNHADRFVVSGNVGGSSTISIPAANDLTVMSFGVYVPSGKSLIIRRIRYKFVASTLRLRVVGITTYTYNMPGGVADDTVNIGIISGNNNTNSVQIRLYNADSQNPAGANPQDGFWIEFDIA